MRLTSRGAAIALLAVAAIALGLVVRLPELVAVAGGLIVLLTVALVAVARTTSVSATAPAAVRVERGSTAGLGIVLVEHGGASLSGMQLRRRGGAGPAAIGLPQLARRVPTTVSIALDTSVRGSTVWGPWDVVRLDAWHLVSRRVTTVEAVEVVVTPRVHSVQVGLLPTSDGESRSSQEAGESDVASLREYLVGDEPRHIHWRSSAKTGSLMVRVLVAARRPGVRVLLDVRRGSYSMPDEFEEAVDAAASIAMTTAITGVTVDVVTTAGETARTGTGRHAGVLDLLSRVELADSDRPLPPSAAGTLIAVTGSGTRDTGRWGARTVIRVGARAGAPGADVPTASGVVCVGSAADLVSARLGRARA